MSKKKATGRRISIKVHRANRLIDDAMNHATADLNYDQLKELAQLQVPVARMFGPSGEILTARIEDEPNPVRRYMRVFQSALLADPQTLVGYGAEADRPILSLGLKFRPKPNKRAQKYEQLKDAGMNLESAALKSGYKNYDSAARVYRRRKNKRS
jgi:hypothetical protein